MLRSAVALLSILAACTDGTEPVDPGLGGDARAAPLDGAGPPEDAGAPEDAAMPADVGPADAGTFTGNVQCEREPVLFGPTRLDTCATRSLRCTKRAGNTDETLSWTLRLGAPPAFDDGTRNRGRATLSLGGSIEIELGYCPTSRGAHRATLHLETDRPEDFSLDVALEGSGGAPDIEVAPAAVDFGQATLLAPVRRTVVVRNVGSDPLEFAEPSLDLGPQSPFAVGPGVPPLHRSGRRRDAGDRAPAHRRGGRARHAAHPLERSRRAERRRVARRRGRGLAAVRLRGEAAGARLRGRRARSPAPAGD